LGILVLVVITVAAQFLKRAPSTLGTAPFGRNIKQLEKEPAQGLSFKEALRSYQFWFMFFIFICYGFASLSISVHIVPHAIETGISATLAATILAALGGSGIIGRLGLGLLGDRLGNRLVMIMGFLGFLASLFFMMFSEAAVILFLFAFIFGVAQGGVSTSQSPLTARLFGLKSHGMIFGFGGLGYTIGAALGPFLTGHIFDITGSYYLAFVSCIIATAIGLILILLMKPIKTVSPDQARF
jgi:OFA family oxalate/formate antiporter-like MFS transporter